MGFSYYIMFYCFKVVCFNYYLFLSLLCFFEMCQLYLGGVINQCGTLLTLFWGPFKNHIGQHYLVFQAGRACESE